MFSVIVYFFCGGAGFLCARNSGATTERGSSNTTSSSAEAAAGGGVGRIQERIQFQGKAIFPRFNACSNSAFGKPSVALGSAATSFLTASGQPPVNWKSGTIKGSNATGAALASGAGAATAGATEGLGATGAAGIAIGGLRVAGEGNG